MKNFYKFILIILLSSGVNVITGQDLEYSFSNATSDGVTYSVDVLISSPNNTGFKLGNGQIYINYNPAAFGVNAVQAGNVVVNPVFLDAKDCQFDGFALFSNFTLNDNFEDRLSFAWTQEAAAAGQDGVDDVITSVPKLLFTLQLTYVNNTEDPNICFASTGVFQDVTFTACGPDGPCNPFATRDCTNQAGNLIANTSFDCSNSVLPVFLTTFTASRFNESSNILNWSTSAERNSSHFEIERSTDVSNWEVLGMVQAAGNSDIEVDYSFIDRNIQLRRNSTKVFYYRLNMIDLDASQEYSEVKAVRLTNEGYADVTVFPNPTAELLNIDISSDLEDGNIKYEITDIKGRRLITESIDISVQRIHTVNLRDKGLESGVYMVRLFNNREILSAQKVVLVSH